MLASRVKAISKSACFNWVTMYVSPVSMIKTRQKREKLSQFPRNECVAAFFTKEKKDTTLEHELSLAPIFLVIHWLIRTIFVEKSPIHISNRTSNTFFPRYDWLILAILPVLSRKDKQKYYSKIYQLVTSSCIQKKSPKNIIPNTLTVTIED